jgi:hypothetical protein
MNCRLLRRLSAVCAAMILVLAVAGPAFANVAEWGTFSCPSRPTYLHAKWQGNAGLVGPGRATEDVYFGGNYWSTATDNGVIGGGFWYAEGTITLDLAQTYPYCG